MCNKPFMLQDYGCRLFWCVGIGFEMNSSYVMGSWDGEMVTCDGP